MKRRTVLASGLAALTAEAQPPEHEVGLGSPTLFAVLERGWIGALDLLVHAFPQLRLDQLRVGTSAHVVAVLSDLPHLPGRELVAAVGPVAGAVEPAGHFSCGRSAVELSEQDRGNMRARIIHHAAADDLLVLTDLRCTR